MLSISRRVCGCLRCTAAHKPSVQILSELSHDTHLNTPDYLRPWCAASARVVAIAHAAYTQWCTLATISSGGAFWPICVHRLCSESTLHASFCFVTFAEPTLLCVMHVKACLQMGCPGCREALCTPWPVCCTWSATSLKDRENAKHHGAG